MSRTLANYFRRPKGENDADLRFSALCTTTIIGKLKVTQLDQLLEFYENSVFSFGTSGIEFLGNKFLEELYGIIFTKVGLPAHPTNADLHKFLQKNSSFYRRQQAIREMKKKK